jgi:DNA-binding transcriptional LysR family regulator
LPATERRIASADALKEAVMEMQQVRYFLALARCLNFTRAAEMANVSQPSLTRAIQQLEAELGGPLFHRERQKTHLSELGRMMLPYFEMIQSQTQEIRAKAKAARRLEDVSLRIIAMCTIAPAIVSDLILSFARNHPGVELHVSDAEAMQVLELLAEGQFHIGLFGAPEQLDERFHSLPLFRERFVVALPPNHRLAGQNVIRVRDLNGEPYVNRSKCEYYDYATREFTELGVTTRRVFSSERDDWVQGMVKAGMGFGFFPEFGVVDPAIVTRRLVEPEFIRTIMLLTVRGRPHSPAVGAFVKEARSFPWPKSEYEPFGAEAAEYAVG